MIAEIPELDSAVRQAIASSGRVEIMPYVADADDTRNEYCFFLKPELATLGDESFRTAINLVADVLNSFDQELVASTVLAGSYLHRHDLMARHYGVINRASVRGLESISPSGEAVLKDLLESQELTKTTVYGGHEFLDEFEYFTPQALSVLHDSVGGKRVSPSVYAIRAVVDGRSIAVLNGFHPMQLEWFYGVSNAIAVFVLRTSEDWKDIRREMTGATLPHEASTGTIRRNLLDASAQLGIDISPLKNGVHVSAGPLEAAVEIARYMSDFDQTAGIPVAATTFGLQALSFVSADKLINLSDNPVVASDGEFTTAFGATEEQNNNEAIKILAEF